MTMINQMITQAVAHLNKAYAPYSDFRVSCCIQGENDQLYVGVNIENVAYPLGTCAEAGAIAQMVTDGCKQIKNVVIITGHGKLCSPCGGCRQRLYEFSLPDTQIFLCDHASVLKQYPLYALLPEAFQF